MSPPTSPQHVIAHARSAESEHVDPSFVQRWSPRAFKTNSIPDDHIRALFEAAQWAPSSYNEQPWRFVYATRKSDRSNLLQALFEGNRIWAKHAPLLIFVLAKRDLESGGANSHAWFDTGAAWMSLALQAERSGLHTHAIGGFDRDLARNILDVPAGYDVVCAIAVGYRGEASQLPEKMAPFEVPSDRKALREIAFEGRFGGQA